MLSSFLLDSFIYFEFKLYKFARLIAEFALSLSFNAFSNESRLLLYANISSFDILSEFKSNIIVDQAVNKFSASLSSALQSTFVLSLSNIELSSSEKFFVFFVSVPVLLVSSVFELELESSCCCESDVLLLFFPSSPDELFALF